VCCCASLLGNGVGSIIQRAVMCKLHLRGASPVLVGRACHDISVPTLNKKTYGVFCRRSNRHLCEFRMYSLHRTSPTKEVEDCVVTRDSPLSLAGSPDCCRRSSLILNWAVVTTAAQSGVNQSQLARLCYRHCVREPRWQAALSNEEICWLSFRRV
jgi:hypothetical protein